MKVDNSLKSLIYALSSESGQSPEEVLNRILRVGITYAVIEPKSQSQIKTINFLINNNPKTTLLLCELRKLLKK